MRNKGNAADYFMFFKRKREQRDTGDTGEARDTVETGEQGLRSGESTRLPSVWPRFNSRRGRHMWVEFVVRSLLCSERFFSGYLGFPLFSKTNKETKHTGDNRVTGNTGEQKVTRRTQGTQRDTGNTTGHRGPKGH